MTNHFLRSCPRGKPVHVARIGPQSWTVTVPLPGDVSGPLNQFDSTFGHPIEFTCSCLLSRNTCTCCDESIYDFWRSLASFVSFAHESYGSLARFESVRKRFIQFYIDLPTVLDAFHGSEREPKDTRSCLIKDAHSVILTQYGEDVADIPWMDWPSCGSNRMTEEHAAELFSADVSVLSHIRALLNRKFGTQSSSTSVSMEKVLVARPGSFILQLGSVLDQLGLSELSEKVLGHFLKNEASFIDEIPFQFLRRINKTLSNTNKLKSKFYSVQYLGRSSPPGDQTPPGEGGLGKLRDKLSRMLMFRKQSLNAYREVNDGLGPLTLSPVDHYADALRQDVAPRALPDLPFRATMLSTKSKSDGVQTVPRLPPPFSAAPEHRQSISFPTSGPSLKGPRGPIADEVIATDGDYGVDELFIPHQPAEVVSELSSGRESTGELFSVRVTPLDLGIPYLDKTKFSASPPSEETPLDLFTKIKGMGQLWPNREPTVVPEAPRPGNRMIRLRERLLEKARQEAAPPLQAPPPEPTQSRDIYPSRRKVLKYPNQTVYTQKGGNHSDDELLSLSSNNSGNKQHPDEMSVGGLSEGPWKTTSEIPLIEDRQYTGSVRNSSRSGYTQSSSTSRSSGTDSDVRKLRQGVQADRNSGNNQGEPVQESPNVRLQSRRPQQDIQPVRLDIYPDEIDVNQSSSPPKLESHVSGSIPLEEGSLTYPGESKINRGVGEVSVNDRLHAHKDTGRLAIKPRRRPKLKLPSVQNIDDWAAQAKADLDDVLNLN